MIKVHIKHDLNQINQIEVSGHASYDDSGKDIVCSAVSTAIIVTINALEKLEVLDQVKYDIEEGYFFMVIDKHNDILNALIDNLVYSLDNLNSQYPKYIKIKKEG
ncbi:MAG: ribosomal-processing cysteine protease Prp [Acholeplasmataceae bacterium]